MISINQNKAIVSDLSPIAQLSTHSDLMKFILEFLNSHDALASGEVCQRWNEIIRTQCIAPILYRELEPQVALFLEHIGATFNQYFSARGLNFLALDSVQKAYDCLKPITWRVSLGNCVGVPDLARITSESILNNIRQHFMHHDWHQDNSWRLNLHKVILDLGFPKSTWNQLALALGVNAEEWNQSLQDTLGPALPSFRLPSYVKKFGVHPDLQTPGFDLMVVAEKIKTHMHTRVKQTPYLQLCEFTKYNPPPLAKDVSIDDMVNEAEEPISFCVDVNGKALYNYFPATLLGCKKEDYEGKNILSLTDSIMGQDFCLPINGQFFKFTIRPAMECNDDPDNSSDDGFIEEVNETFERIIEHNGWKCLSSSLYIPEYEFERTKQKQAGLYRK
jgi:hypothetical protein